jgi:hypothetical protein
LVDFRDSFQIPKSIIEFSCSSISPRGTSDR